MIDPSKLENSSQLEPNYSEADKWINRIYEVFDGDGNRGLVSGYHDRHQIDALLILTVASGCAARAEVAKLRTLIQGKTVIEIGSGVGMLALEMAKHAKHVWAIEADPAWSWVFTHCLYAIKPANLTWIFGRAQDLVGVLHADVAVVYTRSDIKGMGALAKQMAPELIRGPLVDFDERYEQFMTAEQLAYAQKIATEAMINSGFGKRGMSAEVLLEVERKVLERYPELANIPA